MDKITQILPMYIEKIKTIYGNHLQKIILYGSYARGDATDSSDIDIMILVDLEDQEMKEYFDQLSDITFDINLDYDVMIMPIVKNIKHFDYWSEAYPFYKNINKEGVALYGAA